MEKKLVFIIKANQIFIRTNDENAILKNQNKINVLFESVSDLYIPLLEMFERFEKENIDSKLGLVLPPILCNMLENEKIQQLYVEYLEKRIELGKSELERCNSDKTALEIIKIQLEKNNKLKNAFVEKYNSNLIKAFAEYQTKGFVEILATCATDIYIPHYADLPEVISAQIETGLQAYKKSFNDIPEGFFIPECSYVPGVEKIIRAYGYSYTILNARSVLLTDSLPSTGIFYPLRTSNSLGIFTADSSFADQLFGEEGYCTNEVYRNENRDIGFELEASNLMPVLEENTARCATGFKYWKKDFEEDEAASYDYKAACAQATEDAEDFLKNRKELLEKVEACVSDIDFVVSVCCIDDTNIRKNWNEYILWLEAVLRKASKYDISMALCKSMLSKQFSLEKITPYYSSAAGDGYGENFLSSKNCWMMRYVRKASERMIDLADRFPTDTGLKNRLLNIGATELLLAQSSTLAKMIEEDEFAEYAEERFKLSIAAFTAVFDSLGSNTVSTEWLTTLECQDNLFPWMNYKVFSKKQ